MPTRVNERRAISLGIFVVCLAWVFTPSAAVQAAQAASAKAGADTGYLVVADVARREAGATPSFRADNPANNLQLTFTAEGVVAVPRTADADAWSLDLRLLNITFMGEPTRVGLAQISATENGVAYDFGSGSVRYVNGAEGLEQIFTLPAPPVAEGKAGAPKLELELAIGNGLLPQAAGYVVDLVGPDGRTALRYGAIRATDANGTSLTGDIKVVPGSDGQPAGVRIVVELVDPASAVEVHANLSQAAQFAQAQPPAGSGELVGKPVTLGRGITQTVAEIMDRAALAPPPALAAPRATHKEFELELEPQEDPNAPPMLAAPAVPWTPEIQAQLAGPPALPQSVGTSFRAISTASGDSPYIPPDSMGDVGPTQIVVHINGRIRTFNKASGTADGALNVDDVTFWNSVAGAGGISDPEVRFDRLSGRWILNAISIAESVNNKIVFAVSSGPTITSQASFTFYQFNVGTAAPADATSFCDYQSLGIDANAIYTGCNMFTSGGSFRWTSAFVIRKASVLSGGPIVVTGFPTIATTSVAGPYSPRGVDNDDPTWTEGYIIGADPGFLNRINIRRVSNPSGTPTLGANVTLAITNTNMSSQPALGSALNIDVSDRRLFMASIHKNKLTGVTSLWTAHVAEVTSACVTATSGTTRRVGAKWYEIGTLTTTPTITQQGTLCSTGAGGATINSERGFLYPTVVETGQGHVALGASFASSAELAGVAAAGRLRTDASGGTRAPETIVFAGLASYSISDGSRNRWGDYSFTDVDPNDDQTIWTFQEYADTQANNWAIRAVQLKAPPPPVLATATPVCAGLASTTSTVVGTDNCAAPTCTNGLCTGGGTCPEFFDPGPDTGGPGYANHIAASVTGGVTVNPYPATNIVIPASPSTNRVLQATLSLNTIAATPGTKTITITNPDGQSVTSASAILTVNAAPSAPGASNNGPICAGATLNLSASTVAGATYNWTGPNGFTSSAQNPSIPNATGAAGGTYTVTVTVNGCASTGATTAATVSGTGVSCNDNNLCTYNDVCQPGGSCAGTSITCTNDACGTRTCNGTSTCTVTPAADGTACNDGDACTQTDTCQSGACVGANPVVCSASDQCHVAGVCNPGTGTCSNPNSANGTACNDGNACTQTDTCQSGTCTGSNPVVCSASDQCHVAGVCDPQTGFCSNPNAANGTACNDGDACTQTDTCQSGACVGANPVVCSASDQCHVAGVCNPGAGLCSNPTAANGTSCNDGNQCTAGDVCTAGICGGSPVPPPNGVNDSLRADKTPTDTTIAWNDPPGSYNVYRGALPGGSPWGYNQTCFSNGVTGNSTPDTTVPALGELFYYLVSRFNACGESSLGTDSAGAPRPNGSACP